MMAEALWKPLVTEDGSRSSRTKARSSSTANGKSDARSGDGTDELGDEGVRNVKAACIGKLTTMAPAKFLPQLQVCDLACFWRGPARSRRLPRDVELNDQALLKSSPANRAIVAAAVRFTFIDTSSSYDELISPIVVDFLSLMHDENYVSCKPMTYDPSRARQPDTRRADAV